MICMFKVLYCCELMYLRTLKIFVLKYINLILQIFFLAPGLAWQEAFKKTKVKLNLLTDIGMLPMVEKDIRGGTWHSIY